MEFSKILSEIKIIPVVKLDCTEDAVPLAAALIEGGIPAAEVTFRTPCAAQAIASIATAYPNMLLGAGTVLSTQQVDEAIAAGAKFIVSPGFNPVVVQYCQEKKIPIFPGCTTASEVERAIEMGLHILKFFPAEQSGGLAKIKALSGPFSQICWMPTGGISLANLKSYLAFSKVLACGGSFMVKDAYIKEKDWGMIAQVCRQTIALIQDNDQHEEPLASAALFQKSEKPYDVLTMGEVLIRMATPPQQRIVECHSLQCYVGGSELNIAAGVARLGLKSGIITRLPNNDIGKYACNMITSMGVCDKHLSYDSGKSARMGIYYFEGGVAPRKPKVVYDRANSSFWGISSDMLPDDIYSSTRIFHTSGITLALTEVRETVIQTMKRFKEAGSLISMDVNYRAALWDEKTAHDVITRVLPLVDILFVSEETSRRMMQKTGSLQEIMRSYCKEYGVQLVLTTCRKVMSTTQHSWSSIIYFAENDSFVAGDSYESIEIADRIGSGDAYVAGALYGLLEKGNLLDMGAYGDAMGVLKCTIQGDLPNISRNEAETLIAMHKTGDTSEMSR